MGQLDYDLSGASPAAVNIVNKVSNGEISLCFLQDLQSEWEKEQMQKSYKGVKSETCCEVVTVGRRCAAEGAWIQGQASPRMVIGWWQMVPMGL